jgi:WD40 repeat protein
MTIRVWSAGVGVILGTHDAAVNSIAHVSGSKIVSGSGDRSVVLWDVDGGVEKRELGRHERGVACVATDGIIVASGSSDACICVWYGSFYLMIRNMEGGLRFKLTGHQDLVRRYDKVHA